MGAGSNILIAYRNFGNIRTYHPVTPRYDMRLPVDRITSHLVTDLKRSIGARVAYLGNECTT